MYVCTKYKEAKRSFRKELRHAELEYEKKSMNDIMQAESIDQRYFWHLVNRAQGKGNPRKRMQLTRDNDGNMLFCPDAIAKDWGEYYATLHRPCHDPSYDENNKLHVEQALRDIQDSSMTSTFRYFTDEEVEKVCRNLKKRKAAGCDGISPEHIYYGGNALFKALRVLFNSMTAQRYIPDALKKGVIIPIPKGRDRELCDKDNYRGITLMTVVIKVYEKLLLVWLNEECKSKINLFQGANRPGCSSLNTTLALREAICQHRQRGDSVYVALLDARKAFDSVWHDGLFYRLMCMGCPPVLLQVIRELYNKFSCMVNVAGHSSSWFESLQGVHQGAPLSMELYIIFSSGILDALTAEERDITESDALRIACLAYADDICLIAQYKRSMQTLLDTVHRQSRLWRYAYNAKKCSVLIFGKDLSPTVTPRRRQPSTGEPA